MGKRRFMRACGGAAATAALALAFALSGCNGDGGDDTDGGPYGGPGETDTGEDTGTGEAIGVSLGVSETDLGEIVVDAEGMSLYLFTQDSGGESTCYDDCAANWPPLIVDGEPTAGDGIDVALLGTTERDDGSSQVTYNDHPLYYWAADAAPGDVTGQGLNDVWYVVDPSGEPVTEGA